MPSYKDTYQNHPLRYDQLVRAEDADGALGRTLSSLAPLKGARVAEAGAGTGRLTEIALMLEAEHVVATELEPTMLAVAKERLANYSDRTEFVVADARDLPLPDASADVAMAGWVFGHFRGWMPNTWEREAGAAVDHLERVTRSGGVVVVIETLGTGTETPMPAEELREYYAWLEGERGFSRTEIRTDYVFESCEEAAQVTGAFFGEEFGKLVRSAGSARVPECTGLWSRTV